MLMPSIFGENLFDDWFDKDFFPGRNPLYGKNEKNLMKTDVREQGDSYEVAIDLPGFKKEDVAIELENGYLTITASKGLDKDEDQTGYIRRERWSGKCSRTFYVGESVRGEDIKAKMEDGILTMTVPKEQRQLPHKNTIMIEG
ncbi:MAG TPA: Hsp20/alpha crystallin family protein [Candidatus Faecivivens stercorigallinarum]|nr:Hsp20/alpha crystallin family protein [Candidatus Faecivivens stercorigallinarum]